MLKGFWTLVIGALVLWLASPSTIDPDLWWHLRTGQEILQRGIPKIDIFSWTFGGAPWMTHEWLAEVFLFAVHSVGGIAGLVVFFELSGLLVFFLIYLRCERKPYLASIVALLGFSAMALFWGPRPQIFNIVLFSVFLCALDPVYQGKRPVFWLYLLPCGVLLWANLHSGAFLGLVVLGVYAAGSFIEGHFTSGVIKSPLLSTGKHFVAIFMLSILLLTVNPSGARLLTYSFTILTSGFMLGSLNEWRSPDFHNSQLWPFLIFLIVFLMALGSSRKRSSLPETVLLLGAFVASLISIRHIPFFVVLGTPLISRILAPEEKMAQHEESLLPPPQNKKSPIKERWLAIMLSGILFFWIIQDARSSVFYYEFVITLDYPVQAVDFLLQKGLSHNKIFNPYVWGGYLIWRGIPVFADGRADFYGDKFLGRYFKTAEGQDPGWESFFKGYGVETALLRSRSFLASQMSTSPRWKKIYEDGSASIYVLKEYFEKRENDFSGSLALEEGQSP